ncbi:ABC transporter ATP-binding protein [Ignavigranum ruoffiae]|uniref:ABC-type quaternary amine transporter n=1 Tax=Ignavigranum ruoffiae TaxID=89093 RepID=A0A1H9EGV9_9LACT|nr:ABC transporter ATP-binding protein [Ignavigranum ruoffiae]SEQ24812.1 iron(III) transport system ATP-binding protein [Ignavigranum ruoffiae]
MEIKLINLSKSFDHKLVLKDINLTIDSQSFTTLLGPSGCGKTTLLRMIAGLEEPDEGEIYFDDTCVFSRNKGIFVPTEQRGLGFVFQDFALWPHLSVFENVAFGLRVRKYQGNISEVVLEALKKVKLESFAQMKPGSLSGGQQQRVAFARALAIKPDIILFDEPFSALDAILREQMRLEIKNLADESQFTSVFVTHDQIEAMAMSDQIVVLSNGQVEQVGTPEAIYNQPASKFVAQFIGDSNWLDDERMFRTESALLNQEGKGFPVKVMSSEFLGTQYKIHLSYNDKQWIGYSRYKFTKDQHLNMDIQQENIIQVKS